MTSCSREEEPLGDGAILGYRAIKCSYSAVGDPSCLGMTNNRKKRGNEKDDEGFVLKLFMYL
jgi:hypothetical protein